MALLIKREFYKKIRDKFVNLAKNWNGINGIIKLGTNNSPMFADNKQGDVVSGNRGDKIAQYQPIPLNLRNQKYVEYDSSVSNSVKTTIDEEFSKIHTLGNENLIRESLSELNNISYENIDKNLGVTKITIKNIGTTVSDNTVKNAYQNTSNESVDELINGKDAVKFSNTNVESYPYLTSKIDVNGYNVLTYDRDKDIHLKENDVVKYSDYEEINNVLERIEQCLAKRNNWFDGNGRCQLSCQVSCQHTCQLACQGCNTKQCHDQKCGIH